MNLFLITVNILFLVTGQFLWKNSVNGVKKWNLEAFLNVFLSTGFILGAILYVLATVIWIMILSRMPLHIAYPFQSLCYILAAVVSFYFFNEKISIEQWIGFAIIIFGVYLISK